MNEHTKHFFMRLGLSHALKLLDEAERTHNPQLVKDYLSQYSSVIEQACLDKIRDYTEEAVVHENEGAIDQLKDLLDEVTHSELDEKTIRIVEVEIERAYQKIIASAIYQICMHHAKELFNYYQQLTQKLDAPQWEMVDELQHLKSVIEKTIQAGDLEEAYEHYRVFHAAWNSLPQYAKDRLQQEWVFLNPKTLAVLANAHAFDFMLELAQFHYPSRAYQLLLPKLIAHPQISPDCIEDFLHFACEHLTEERQLFLDKAADFIEEALVRHEDHLAATIMSLCDKHGVPINDAYLLYVTAIEKEAFHTMAVMDKIQLLEESFVLSFIESHIHSQVSANKIILDVKPIQTALENVPQHLTPIHFDPDAHYQYIFGFNDPVLIYFMLTCADAEGFKAFVKRYKNKAQLEGLQGVMQEFFHREYQQATPEQQRWLDHIQHNQRFAWYAFMHLEDISTGFFDFSFRA